jgi:WD40 repeat protein
MEFEQVLRIADEAVTRLRGRGLTDAERVVLKGSCNDQSYEKMAEGSGFSDKYLKQDIGPKLWKLLSEALGRKVSKKTFKTAFQLYIPEPEVDSSDSPSTRSHPTPPSNSEGMPSALPESSDWEELAVDVSEFYGRQDERSRLESLLLSKRCRLVILHGMTGIGKTWLSQAVKQQVQASFAHVICLSLYHRPSPTQLLAKLLHQLTRHQDGHIPQTFDGLMSRLLRYFNQHACLVILDDGDAVFQEDTLAGQYRDGYGDYQKILRQLVTNPHQSCVLWVSQAEPDGLDYIASGVEEFSLSGFSWDEGRAWLHVQNGLNGTEAERLDLIKRCSGHPAVIQRILSRRVLDIVGRQLVELLNHWPSIVEHVQDQFDDSFNQLTDVEQQVMYWLAIAQMPLTFRQLETYMISPLSREVMVSLMRRSLCSPIQSDVGQSPRFAQPAIVMAYVLHRFLAAIKQELTTEHPTLLNSHALLTTQAPEYIQNQQRHLILNPLIEHIRYHYSSPHTKLRQLLTHVIQTVGCTVNYAIGNLINLLQPFDPDFSGFDFSGMTIRQADFRRTVLHGANFARAQLQHSIFAQAVGGSMVLAFSPDSRLLATGNEDGKTFLWDVSQGQLMLNAHYSTEFHAAVRSLAFSPDLSTLAVGGDSRTVQLWNIHPEQAWHQPLLHPASVRCICFSPDRRILASNSDGCIYMWDNNTGQLIRILTSHAGEITSLSFDDSGQQLLSCSNDQRVHLWAVTRSEPQQTLTSSTNGRFQTVLFRRSYPPASLDQSTVAIAVECNERTIRLWSVETGDVYATLLLDPDEKVVAIAISADGQRIASSSVVSGQYPLQPSTSLRWCVKLWDVSTQQCLHRLSDLEHQVQTLAFSPDSRLLATAGDRRLALWDVETGRCLSALRDSRELVRVFSFNHDYTSLITGQQNHAIRQWDIQSGRCQQTLLGHTNWVQVLTASPDGCWLASSSGETIRVWDLRTGTSTSLPGRVDDPVRVLCFNPTASILASGTDDATIVLWNIYTRQSMLLEGHRDRISALCFNPDGRWLVSGSDDHTVTVWNTQTGAPVFKFDEHDDRIHSLSLSTDGQTLVSASRDGVAKSWSLSTGKRQITWQKPDQWLYAVQMDAAGRAIAATSTPGSTQMMQIWDIQSDVLLQTLTWEQASNLWRVIFSANGEYIAIGSNNGPIYIWQWATRQLLRRLRTDCPYEGMTIQDMTIHGQALSAVQVEMLKQLGATE